MGLFGKKKDTEKEKEKRNAKREAEEAAAAVAEKRAEEGAGGGEAAEGAEGAASPEPEKPAPIPAETFSKRIASVFGRMYLLVISINLPANVCQIESGERILFGKELPVRMYYSDFLQRIDANIAPFDRDAFHDTFDAENLMKALTGDEQRAAGVYSVGTEEEINDYEAALHFWELRADVIPGGNPPGSRAILYIREMDRRPAKEQLTIDESDENAVRRKEWNDVRMATLLGTKEPLFFEYDVKADIMHLHAKSADAVPEEILNYRKNLESRSDWTVFHSDIGLLRKTLEKAINGEEATADIRYRADGGKGSKFHIHKITASPASKEVPADWVVGALIDTDEQVRTETRRREITNQINRIVGETYEQIYEIDLDKDTICRVERDEESFVREDQSFSFSRTVREMIDTKAVHPDSVQIYENILKSGFLEKRTMAANYDTDVRLRKNTMTDYTWYSLTIAKIAGNRYLMLLHDASEIQAMRQKSAEYAEMGRFSTYSRRILESVASLIEFRSLETGTHIERVESITKILLESVAELCPEYEIDKRYIDLYTEGAILHDIGKIIVPDNVLNKAGKLTDEEMNLLRRHTVFGAQIIDRLTVKGQEELQAVYKDVALHHHERYDGHGYPDGLVGDQIEIGVQVVALADVYDALVSPRVYKAGIDHNKAVQMIMNGETGAFNPKLLQCFRLNVAKIQDLYGADVRKNS